MDYGAFVASHRALGADISVAALPVTPGQGQSFGLMRTDASRRILEFREKPRDDALAEMRVDTAVYGLSPEEARDKPYLASMGIYVFSRQALFDLLDQNPSATDFGKEIIPTALQRHDLRAYLFNDYWEDIGTIRAFYEANLVLTDQPLPAFSFYDEDFPIYTRPRYLPPTKLLDSHVTESILGDGSILKSCSIHKCVLGVRSRIGTGAVLQDTLTMGSDSYESNAQREAVRAKGGIPLGVGDGSTVKGAILDKNVRIGSNVRIVNKDRIEEADRPELGFYIRSSLVVVIKNATIPNNMVI